MARRKFRTPPTLPEDTQCRGLVIPSSKEWLGLYSDALLELTKTYNYNQVEPTDLTPEETAALAYEQYVAWLSAACGGECPPVALPSGSKIYRHSPTTGRIEYLAEDGSGDWLEPAGDDALPSPTARTEPTEADRLCAAATNAVECIRVTLETVLDEWNAASEPAQAITSMVTAIVGWAGATFYPPMLGFVLLAEAAFNIFYELMDVISWNFWDGDFENALICSFRSNATDTDGTITFDMDAIVADLRQQLWTRGEYVLLVTQVQYLLSIVGKQALDMAGTTTSVQGNCTSCGTWCYEATPEAIGVTILNGYFTSLGEVHDAPYSTYRTADMQLVVDTTNCVITRIGVEVLCGGGTTGVLWLIASPSTGPIEYMNYYEALGGVGYRRYTDDNANWASNSPSTTIRIYGDYSYPTERNLRFSKLIIYGTGTSPWGASNC